MQPDESGEQGAETASHSGGRYVPPSWISHGRLLIQAGFGIFTLWMGYRFFLFYQWAVGASDKFVPRPPSVEGFLPISALLGLKQLLFTGTYDRIHPAGLTIFIAAMVIGLAFRKGFCGWICPVGFLSNLAEKAGRKTAILMRPPRWVDIPLLSLKYILLAFFLYVILVRMDINAVQNFIRSPYNLAADAKMLLFFLDMSRLALGILLFLVVISFFLKNFWCRYLCPYGALLGILALASPLSIRREEEKCINCRLCDKICPGAIHVSTKTSVRSPECIGCGECIAVCPRKECLNLTTVGRRSLPPLVLPLGVVALFMLFWLWAKTSAHWESPLPPEVYKKMYTLVSKMNHPSF